MTLPSPLSPETITDATTATPNAHSGHHTEERAAINGLIAHVGGMAGGPVPVGRSDWYTGVNIFDASATEVTLITVPIPLGVTPLTLWKIEAAGSAENWSDDPVEYTFSLKRAGSGSGIRTLDMPLDPGQEVEWGLSIDLLMTDDDVWLDTQIMKWHLVVADSVSHETLSTLERFDIVNTGGHPGDDLLVTIQATSGAGSAPAFSMRFFTALQFDG